MVPSNQTDTHVYGNLEFISPALMPTYASMAERNHHPSKGLGGGEGRGVESYLEILKIFLRKTRISLKKVILRLTPKKQIIF